MLINENDSLAGITMNQGLRIMQEMKKFDDDKKKLIVERRAKIIEAGNVVAENAASIREIHASMLTEVRFAAKTNPFKDLSEQQADTDQFAATITGTNFINVLNKILSTFDNAYTQLANTCFRMIPGDIISSKKTDINGQISAQSTDDLKDYIYEYQLNAGAIKNYASALIMLDSCKEFIAKDLRELTKVLSNYYMYLKDKHSVKGIKVYTDPILTDVAYAIYENVDAHGEVQNGTKPNEVSAYTINKALVVVQAASHPIVSRVISEPDLLIQYIEDGVQLLMDIISQTQEFMQDEISAVNQIIGGSIYAIMFPSLKVGDTEVKRELDRLRDVNPSSVTCNKDVFISQDERFAREFEEDTIKEIVDLIQAKAGPRQIVDYILNRKDKLKKHFQEENTFYVCRVSQGNPFLGVAPGGLEVIPGKRPHIELEHIIGSGFDEIREFYSSIEAGAQWNPLFVATSPSKSADKSNCLMIGPPGCGKTEIMRAIGGHKDCIGIFAQGSDFLTCWKGEAEKNPKRLFEQALKLHRESKKRVYILIDECDSVMHKPEGHNDINLTLEFQILMDGIVSYPGISVWGATNNPERLPMAMLRRFSKVKIVGELSNIDIQYLLKQFLGYLPQKNFEPDSWEDAANSLSGATGDVIRQICDHIWRKKMYNFTKYNKNGAKEMMDHLKASGDDFDISKFDDKQRVLFKNKLSKYVNITPNDLTESINIHLKNIAIVSEIETATNTYAKAKQFLQKFDN